jgi:hypothetical protein
VPNKPLDTGATWTLHHAGQESTQCRVTGMESVLGIGCVKVETMQQSQNWDADNIALPAWMNRASIWIDPKSRIVRRLHRDYRVRRPGDTQPSQALLAQYDLTSDFQYHGEHLQQRIADFRAGHTAQNHLEQALASIDRQRPRLLANLKDTIELTLRDKLYWTPYRPAILAMISLADYKSNESKAGETVRQRSEPQSLLGRKARNFVIRVAETDETLTLKKVAGKPVVLVFMDPSSPLSIRALRTAVWAAQNHAELAPTVYAVCTEIGEDTAKQLKEAVPGAFTICTGKGIDRAYGVDAVPYTLYIDASGYLRGSYVGYGPEMTTALVADLRRKEADVENVGKGGGTSPSFLR